MALYDDIQGRLLDGRYRVTRRLGAGAFGVVVAATHECLGVPLRTVAVKLFHGRLVSRDNAAEVFHEALLLEALAQPARSRGEETHLVAIHDAGVLRDDHHVPFVAMEYVDGGSLRQRLQAAGALPLDTVLRLAGAACSGLALAHDASPPVIHRDVKPENVLLTAGGHVKLADFGLAVDRWQAFLQAGQAGTIGYAPPESRDGSPASPAFDVYSLGVVMLELLAGVNPLLAVVRRARQAGRPPDAELAAAQERLARLEDPESGRPLPGRLAELRACPAFQEVLAACLAPAPGARYPHARALGAALAACRAGPLAAPELPPPEAAGEGLRRRLRLARRHLSRAEPEPARRLLEEARQLDPREPEVAFGLSRLYEQRGDLGESIRQQELGLKLRRSGAEMERLADLYERAGKAATARSTRLLARSLGGAR